jgi:hypothetical protein
MRVRASFPLKESESNVFAAVAQKVKFVDSFAVPE